MEVKETQGRGALTDRIKEKSKELIGREIHLRELRLIPYIQYLMCNTPKVDFRRVNDEEMEFLNGWEKEGFITLAGDGYLTVTKEFWDFMCEILYLGYVDLSK